MNSKQGVGREAERIVREILEDLGEICVLPQQDVPVGGRRSDIVVEATRGETKFTILIDAKTRITPQIAISVCEKMRRLPSHHVRAIYAPVISPRVAEIAEQFGVGYVDQAGNCRLRSAAAGLLIDRRGHKHTSRPPQTIADPFSPKSSRIIRALLSRPAAGWKVRELSEHPDVGVSVGLVSKVKRALVEEGYAIEHQRLVYLRDPVGLLENWAKKYSGPAEQTPLYFRGNAEAAERAVQQWCKDHDIQWALAGFSAAWRIAPEVRYNVAAVYVESRGFDRDMLDRLNSYQGGKRVETGANLQLWRPFDASVFANSEPRSRAKTPVTSALQTYLDLKQQAGRGDDAATAVYKKHLDRQLQQAAERVGGLRHDEL